MSFHASTEEGSITLEGGHILKARLLNVDGEACDAQIDLNSCLSNDDGILSWGGEGFSDSAENIELSLEGDDNVPVLRCDLRNIEGELVATDKNLGERIGNNNGEFVFE